MNEPFAQSSEDVDEPSCVPGADGCGSVGPAPGQEFLRQALGSNASDMRVPALLLTLALLLAVVAWVVRRRRVTADGEDTEDAEDTRND